MVYGIGVNVGLSPGKATFRKSRGGPLDFCSMWHELCLLGHNNQNRFQKI